MPLDFYIQSKDTGFNYNEAIQPVENGEDANQTTFRRPSENVRTRTEDIRKQFDLLEAVVSSDRGLTIMASPGTYVHWDHTTGEFELTDSPSVGGTSRDLYIIPLLSTAQALTSGVHIPATFVYNDTVGSGAFVTEAASDLRDHGDTGASRRSGANNLFIEVVESSRTTGGVVIGVSGDDAGGLTFPKDGPVLITLEMEQGGNTASEVVAALQAAGAHDSYINTDSAKTKVLAAGNCTKEITRRRFGDGEDTYNDAGTIYRSMGAIDPEGINVTSSDISTFFATATNKLDTGDTLAVNFTGADDRLNNQTDSVMTDMLVKISSVTGGSWEKIDSGHAARRHTIPVCKVVGDSLFFLNGVMVESGEPGLLVPTPGAMALKSDFDAHVSDYDAHVAGTADQHPSADITSAAHAGSPRSLSASEVDTNLNELLGFYNNHAAGSADKHAFTDMASPFRVQIVRNNGWEQKQTFWTLNDGGGVTLSLGTGAPLHEGAYYLHANADGVSAGTGYATQTSLMPCAPGQTIKISAWVYASTWASSGFNGVRVSFYDKDLADIGSDTLSFSTGSYAWTEVTGSITAPAGTVYVSYVRVEADNDGSTSGELRVDSVNVWLENDSIETAKRLIEHAGEGRLRELSIGLRLPDASYNDDFTLYYKSGGGGSTPVAGLKHSSVDGEFDIDSDVLMKPLKDIAKTTAPDHAAGLHKTNVCLAWGVVEMSSGTPTLLDGYNVNTVGSSGSGKCDITFHNSLSDANYCVVFGSPAISTAVKPHTTGVAVKTTGGFSYYCWYWESGDFHLQDDAVTHFAIFGRE